MSKADTAAQAAALSARGLMLPLVTIADSAKCTVRGTMVALVTIADGIADSKLVDRNTLVSRKVIRKSAGMAVSERERTVCDF